MKSTGEDFQYILSRYILERLMARISLSAYSNRFIVKGAMLFLIWDQIPFRSTLDLDLTLNSIASQPEIIRIFKEFILISIKEDAVTFLPSSLSVEPIREQEAYSGIRLHIMAQLGKTITPVHIDIGFAEAITPSPKMESFPTLLQMRSPHLLCYPPETIVAEKLDAILNYGLDNSRMKDYFDLWILSSQFVFDGLVLSSALRNTFRRRKRNHHPDLPEGLSDEFISIASPRWNAFLKRTHLFVPSPDFSDVVSGLRTFLLLPLENAISNREFNRRWPKGGPWQ
jgi:hypothetical protein